VSAPIKQGDRVILARVSMDVIIPNGAATEQQVTEWLRFYLSHSGMLHNSNPLFDHEPEVIASSVSWDVMRIVEIVQKHQSWKFRMLCQVCLTPKRRISSKFEKSLIRKCQFQQIDRRILSQSVLTFQ